jgi:hypothetical protein
MMSALPHAASSTFYGVLECGRFRHKSNAMATRAEIVIESRNRRPILVVECRRAHGSSSEYAVRWRRNLEALPDFTAPAQPMLKRYLGPIAERPGGPIEESLEYALYAWLSELAHGVRQPEALSEADQMLVTSGLLERMKGSTFRMEWPS